MAFKLSAGDGGIYMMMITYHCTASLYTPENQLGVSETLSETTTPKQCSLIFVGTYLILKV